MFQILKIILDLKTLYRHYTVLTRVSSFKMFICEPVKNIWYPQGPNECFLFLFHIPYTMYYYLWKRILFHKNHTLIILTIHDTIGRLRY